MAKMRGIKPEFWTDEDIVELSVSARLLLIGLWNFACDNGHLPDKPKQIKMRVLPADDVDVEALLDELERSRRIARSDGTITVHNFAKHQKPNRRYWLTCDVDGCERSASTPDNVAEGATASPKSAAKVEQALPPADGDGDGDGDGDDQKTSSSAGRAKRGTRLTEDWRPSTENRDHLAAEFPNVDQTAEFWKFQNHWMAKPGKDATKLDWNRTYSNWIRTAAERRPTRGTVTPFQTRSEWDQPDEPPEDPAEYEQWVRDRAARRIS